VRIGRYEVLKHLATGGMAHIFLARQTGLGEFERHVVLKTILRDRAADQRFVSMFLDEAKLAATLNHQNVAQVFEVDQADGNYFMAMEYVHGENARSILENVLRKGWTIPLELAVMIASGAAAGLHHAHERLGKNGQPLHIVHRDVSPANIMVGYDGSIKVLDFGIAKAEERSTKTIGGTIKGKYGYMSPEQCKGREIDRRSDIFALGIVLYELTTLRRAFKGADDFETMTRIVGGELMPPSHAVPGYPPELEAIVLTALATDPDARFQTAQELVDALDTFAVRWKLTTSNTAIGRFLTQLFGERKEPWVEDARGVQNEGGGTRDETNELKPPVDDAATVVNEPGHAGFTLMPSNNLVPPSEPAPPAPELVAQLEARKQAQARAQQASLAAAEQRSSANRTILGPAPAFSASAGVSQAMPASTSSPGIPIPQPQFTGAYPHAAPVHTPSGVQLPIHAPTLGEVGVVGVHPKFTPEPDANVRPRRTWLWVALVVLAGAIAAVVAVAS
jgi:serine/threonine protein kinase